MSFPIKPIGNKLLVKPLIRKDEKVNSIVIPGVANSELSRASVAAISQDLEKVYSISDTILYPSKAGVGQLISGEPHIWLRGDEIWGIEE